jgi:DNA polymerase-1
LVLTPSNGNTGEWIGVDEVRARMGFEPKQIIDYKALRGDSSDNIPGVHGIGEKTAKSLIETYGGIEEIYKNIDKVEPASVREKLANNAEMAVMSKNLATIDTNAPVTLVLKDCKYNQFDRTAIKAVLERYNFKSLLKRLGLDISASKRTEEVDKDQMKLL